MAKTVNYTPEQTARAVEMYMTVVESSEDERAAMVKTIAAELGKNERSIRSKLSREKVYVPKKVVSKVTGETPAKKIELAERLRTVSRANINAENVAKMNKVDITRLIEAFESRDAVEEVDAE
jgi:MoxR-like ATPase